MTILLVVFACFSALTWRHNQGLALELRKSEQEVRSLTQELDHVETNRALEPAMRAEQRRTFKRIRSMHGFPFTVVERVTLENGAELILFHADSASIPGTTESLAVLVADGVLVKTVYRESNSRVEKHNATIEDFNSDGRLDLVFRFRRFDFGRSAAQPKPLAYTILGSDFRVFEEIRHNKTR